MIGKAREIEALRYGEQFARLPGPERARAAQVDVEAGERRRDLNVERLSNTLQRLGERPRHDGSWLKLGREQRAGVDLDDVVRPRAHEADLHVAVGQRARMKRRAPPPGAMRIDERADLGLHALAGEGGDDGCRASRRRKVRPACVAPRSRRRSPK